MCSNLDGDILGVKGQGKCEYIVFSQDLTHGAITTKLNTSG